MQSQELNMFIGGQCEFSVTLNSHCQVAIGQEEFPLEYSPPENQKD